MSDSRRYEKGSDRDKHRRESSRKDYRDRSAYERSNHKRNYPDDSSSYRGKDRREDREGKSHRSSDNHRYEESPDVRRKNSRDDRSSKKDDSRRSRDDERGQRNDHSEKRNDIDRKREKFDEARRKRRRSEEKDYEYGKPATEAESSKNDEDKAEAKKIEPDYKLSGNLSKDTNTYKGVVIKYSEPPEAKQPKTRWRLYVFKEDQTLPTIYVHRQSAFLLGRDRRVADIPIDHPSCSSQHAALQYRLVDIEKEDGTFGKKVKPYIIDLESTNGTYVNNNRIEPSRYFELKEKDMVKFGYSSREYILLHENSKDDLPESDTEENTKTPDQ